ncbi:UPF0271 protein [Mesonia phycicola]|uniref:UPF0271 protein n=1 Tax=Mesonia phycicola TaxID=579105 RepID=A0A1M6DTY9_9FLAO|nr:5-oxoprolinase subunit PxpA [Mesonia phycicola]SHI76633.1 UPF0271 protein [Mesonia phycicola]
MIQIDINCDLAEGGKFDAQLMPLISSCNIACGGHFGNQTTINTAVKLAAKYGVNIGAHPSYPDPNNFGRKSIDMSLDDLKTTLKNQILKVKIAAENLGKKLHHVKPHGALYNDLVRDEKKAHVLVDLVEEIDVELVLFVPPKSVIKQIAQSRLKIWVEGFADRNYEADFSLVSRSKNNAVLHQKEAVFQHVFSMIFKGKIQLKKDTFLHANFNTICVHSDTENSVEILSYLKEKLTANNINIGGR